MRPLLLMLAAVMMTACGPDAAPFPGFVREYAYAFDLDTGTAEVGLQLQVPAAHQERCISLHTALPTQQLRLEDAAGAEVSRTGEVVSVCDVPREEPLWLRARLDVPVGTREFSQVGFSRRADSAGRQSSYLLGWVEACDEIGLCDPDPATLSTFTFEIHHAAEQVVTCAGSRTVEDGVTRCKLDGLAPTYSAFGIAANPGWVRKPFVTAAGVEVVFLEAAEGALSRQIDAALVGNFLEWMTEWFGPFPYGAELRIATAPTDWIGMEHPASIVLREDLASLPPTYADLPLHATLHEIAHQWAGNRTTLSSARDFAWKEAAAEYLVYAFEELRRPHDAPVTRRAWHSGAVSAAHYPFPQDVPLAPLEQWGPSTYGTGPMLLFLQLEPLVGREGLLRALRSFLEPGTPRGVRDWKAVLEVATDRNLTAYFDAWVEGTGEPVWPTFQVATTQAGGEVTVTLTQENGGRFPCAVEVEIAGGTGQARILIDFGLAPTRSTASARVAFAEPVETVRVDPDRRVVDLTLATPDREPPLRWHPY